MRPSWCAAIAILRGLPASGMFQYRDNSGTGPRGLHHTSQRVPARDRRIKISLKDFRTLMASPWCWNRLSRIHQRQRPRPAASRCVEAVRAAADELSNTPAICRKRLCP